MKYRVINRGTGATEATNKTFREAVETISAREAEAIRNDTFEPETYEIKEEPEA